MATVTSGLLTIVKTGITIVSYFGKATLGHSWSRESFISRFANVIKHTRALKYQKAKYSFCLFKSHRKMNVTRVHIKHGSIGRNGRWFFFFSFSSYYEISTIIILITFHLSEKTNERDTQAGDMKTDLVIIWIIRIFARDISLLSG